ncbi:response regulator [Flavobacterium johnsoniae]|uniref:Response regulator receiver domain-containing protein n=1 Tax=Flavobacterium johnsoniae TaxID=986 RepID=A0A1M5VA40_FLAJO|nr:response regulator [Flavobacterium johnsoniae]SHH72076.1 Response regulator receiver domain-containing protein [Flavobacterium johnsoniae]
MSYRNILLIDDDHDDTQFFVEAVQAVNKEAVCLTSENPVKALKELETTEQLPDIIFLDYNMPAVNGLEFLKRMGQIERLKNIEVIVLSTPPEEVMIPWLDRNNISVKYISKPVRMEELQEILKELFY